MMNSDYQSVLQQVCTWPPGQRLALAQQILRSLEETLPTHPRKSVKDLLGLLQIDGPPPTDAECRQLLEEELLRKHGP